MRHRFFSGLEAPLHICHRGGAKRYPENTLYAFEHAVKVHRTDMLELDVHASRDGVVVVAHDATLERCTNGTGALKNLPWAELSKLDAAFHFTPAGGSGTPLRGRGIGLSRLSDVLSAFPGLKINVELKDEAALAPFVDLVRGTDELDRLCIGSEHDGIGEELVKVLPDACYFFPANALAAFVFAVKGGEEPPEGPWTVLDLPYEWEGLVVFDAQLARAAAAKGKWINVWTVDDPAQMRQAIADGVGGIMTDLPDVLRAVLDEPRSGRVST
ncbi:MAG: glycerophosphodiester phosphodiesterase [Myxococcales bacterium]|nr:glycerophosphodiester phosphodiesterase [Myxococcales bacterium]